MDTTDNSRKFGAVEEGLELIRLWSEGILIDDIGALFGRWLRRRRRSSAIRISISGQESMRSKYTLMLYQRIALEVARHQRWGTDDDSGV
ncbi:hypothetical protein [Pseudorhizobium flavum]|uniref:hypothetical protein n=1 Tax=Pseudorhizobium flavum TaxID=1335061 RepID=UPI002490CEE1|nr:hypothetical protein [Pseudorhizobium flavum]